MTTKFAAIPAGPVNRTGLDMWRPDSQTFFAPPSARSYEISIPEQPGPTTSTLLPRKGAAFLYSQACSSGPAKLARPSQSGTTGWRS